MKTENLNVLNWRNKIMSSSLYIHDVHKLEIEEYPTKLYRDSGKSPFYTKNLTIKDNKGNTYNITLVSDDKDCLDSNRVK